MIDRTAVLSARAGKSATKTALASARISAVPQRAGVQLWCSQRTLVCARPGQGGSASNAGQADPASSEPVHQEPTPRISAWSLIPSRVASRVWGLVNSVPLPPGVRSVAYRTWAKVFDAHLHEAHCDSLEEYKSLQEFFTRAVKPGTHTIDPRPDVLVSPVDGRVVSVCELCQTSGMLEQVKGIDYPVETFLGFKPKPRNPSNKIMATVLYLSPGDYHRYHSPTEWTVHARTHFAGQLLPVNKAAVTMVPGLFALNERVALFGDWCNGFFSYTAVGATNVGSMRMHFDNQLRTNRWGTSSRLVARRLYDAGVELQRGEEMGMFKLGSTIVMVFEAPADYTWTVKCGDKVRLGQAICMPEDKAKAQPEEDPVSSPSGAESPSTPPAAMRLTGSNWGWSAEESGADSDSSEDEGLTPNAAATMRTQMQYLRTHGIAVRSLSHRAGSTSGLSSMCS